MSTPSERRATLRGASRFGVVGLSLLALLTLIAVLAPLLAPYAPGQPSGAPFLPPSARHLLGTDDFGNDLLTQLLYGARVSLAIGLAVGVAATGLGALVGSLAGFLRGATDVVLMRIVDVVLVLPFLPLLLVLAAFLGPGLGVQVLVITAVMWARPARELRAQVLSIRERGHVQAAVAMGAGTRHILRRHVLPDVGPLLAPQFVRAAKAAILLEASLGFLGLGDPTVQSWGSTLYYANVRGAFLLDAWTWWVLPPGLALGATVVAFALIGTALEERYRPRLRSGWTLRPRSGQVKGGTSSREAADREALVSIEDLSVAYAAWPEPVRAVDRVTLRVDAGETVGIIGESGSGKTTLASAVLRVLPSPAELVGGRVLADGHDVAGFGEPEMQALRGGRVALIPQSAMNALNPLQRVGAQVAEAARIHGRGDGRAASDLAQRLLNDVGLAGRAGAYPHELSGGMRQRVLIAMALAGEPSLLIADEPTTGLDVVTQKEILTQLRTLRDRRGLSLLLITHDMPAALGACDRILVMQRGRIVEEGTPDQLADRPEHEHTRRLVSARPGFEDPRDRAVNGGGGSVRAPTAETSDAAAQHLLRVDRVRKVFEGRGRRATHRVALDDVSFELGEGETLGLIGRSGAGKSTLARMIAGLVHADGGRILLDGRDRGQLSGRDAARIVQLVFQDPYDALPPGARVRDIVAEPLIIQDRAMRDNHERVQRALEAVDLTPVDRFADRYAHELSGGERQRVALARAIVLRPRVIVADEPTSLLDAPLRLGLTRLMRNLRDTYGTAFLYITHDVTLAASFCDRIAVLAEGRIVEEGVTRDIIAGPRHAETRALVAAAARRLAK